MDEIIQIGLADALRRLIEAGADLPPERVLADQLQVSRHQLRRAMAAVRAEGVMPQPPRPGRAPRKRSEALVGGTNPLEVIELRLVLEPALAGFAALRASPQEIIRIQRAAHTPAGVDPGVADIAFHSAVAAASHNVLAADLYTLLREVGTDARLRVGSGRPLTPDHLLRRDGEHQAIAAAIAARDTVAAGAAMRDHLVGVERQVRNRLAWG